MFLSNFFCNYSLGNTLLSWKPFPKVFCVLDFFFFSVCFCIPSCFSDESSCLKK